MLNIRTAILVAGLGVAAFAGTASAASAKGFVIENTNAEVAIEQVWFAHNGETDPWQAVDLNGPVAPNSQGEVEVSGGTSCFYDVKVQFSDGTVQTFANINACHVDRVLAS